MHHEAMTPRTLDARWPLPQRTWRPGTGAYGVSACRRVAIYASALAAPGGALAASLAAEPEDERETIRRVLDAAGIAAAVGAPPRGAPLARVPDWCATCARAIDHVEGLATPAAVEATCRRHRTGIPTFARELLARRLRWLRGWMRPDDARACVARWIVEGPGAPARAASRAPLVAGWG